MSNRTREYPASQRRAASTVRSIGVASTPDHAAGAARPTADGWVARLASPDRSDADCAAFGAWCAASPDHQRDYVRADHLHARTRELSTDALIAAAARSARRAAAATPAVRRRRFPWRGIAASIAVVAAVATTVLATRWRDIPEQRYATRVGERLDVRLDDGTRAVLDTDTAIAVRYARSRRELTVERGRVDIDVANDAARPFVTYAANGTIVDVGTRFQVARTADRVTVTLLSGEVSVTTDATQAPTVLRPGTQARFDARGDVVRANADVDAANAWTRGELVFKHRPLADLVDEMNRYSSTRIRLADPTLGEIPVSGVFRAGDQDSLIKALESGWALRVERVSDREVVLRPLRRDAKNDAAAIERR